MPAKGFLSLQQKQHLQKLLKQSDTCGGLRPRSEIRERVFILLLMNDGRTQKEIAALIGCSRRSVAYWCVHGDPDTVERRNFTDSRLGFNCVDISIPLVCTGSVLV